MTIRTRYDSECYVTGKDIGILIILDTAAEEVTLQHEESKDSESTHQDMSRGKKLYICQKYP